MQTPTFLPQASANQSVRQVALSFLAALAVFLTFGLRSAQAAVGLSNQQVIVNQGNGNNTYAEGVYDGSTLIDQKPGSTTTPKFDINTGTLILNGGTLNTTETGTSVVNGAFLDYTIYDPSFNPVSSGAIQLTQTSVSGGVRTFVLSTANISVIPLINAAGNGYSISASFRATFRNGGGPVLTARDDNGGAGYTASFDVVGTRTPAPTVNPNNIQLAADGAASPNSYFFPNTGTNPQFPGYNFCSNQNAGGTTCAFDINNGQLRLTNTSVTTTEAGPNTVTGVVLYYRVRSTSSGGGAFQPITLSQSGTSSGGTRTFIIDPNNTSNTNPQPNLVATPAVTSIGNYAIDVYYQASGVNSSTGTPFTVTYPPTGYSTAYFTVGGTPIALTIWTGAINDNWFDVGNWTNGVPNSATNALIRDLGTGNSVPYPNIRSDFRYTTAGGALIYDNTGSGPAQTLNFTMGGSSQASRSIARLVVGQLRVFGTFDNSYDSFIQRDNTIMEFAGGNQNITGGSFVRVDISGGGTKTLQGQMTISESINFLTPTVYSTADTPVPVVNPYATLSTNAGVLATDITQPSTNVVFLGDRATQNQNNGAQINGETDASYLYGFLRTTRTSVVVGETRTYGNMGMTLTFTGVNDPNNVEITRNTVEAYSPVANVYGIRRIFGVRPSNQTTNNGGLAANMVFHYRNAETKRLNGSSTQAYGTGRIQEQNLTIFVSSNSGNTFSLVGRDAAPDTVNNTVTRTGVRTFATFTLGDVTNPLPVKLVAFNAVRSGANALLSWTTASEENNRGFNVQSSADGVTYTTLSFVPSKLVNSVQSLNYTYTDAESGRYGTRYYRLEQVDLDGKTTYSPVRVVSFDGETAGKLALAAYPNPFTTTVDLTLEGATASDGMAQVKLIDVTGRTVLDQKVALTGASLSLGDLSGLHAGLYQAKVMLPDGTAKSVRVQKQ